MKIIMIKNSIQITAQTLRDACPWQGNAWSTVIVILTWFLLHDKIELKSVLSLGLDLLLIFLLIA